MFKYKALRKDTSFYIALLTDGILATTIQVAF